jgi:hypothetical protein
LKAFVKRLRGLRITEKKFGLETGEEKTENELGSDSLLAVG